MRTVKIIQVILLTFLLEQSIAQDLIPVGEWRTHFNYEQTTLVEVVNDKIFASTSNSVVMYDPNSDEISALSKMDGLSDVKISAMSFDEANQRLVLGYQNGNLDLIEGSDIYNNPILLNTNISDDKRILDISFYQSTINLSTGFGVLVVDAETDEVKESYRNLGPNGESIIVHGSAFQGSIMYLATSEGVMYADRNSGDNLQDFNNWERFIDTLSARQSYNSVVFFNDTIYAARDSVIVYQVEPNEWLTIPDSIFPNVKIRKLRESEGNLLMLTEDTTYQIHNVTTINKIATNEEDSLLDMIKRNDEFWFADSEKGLSRLKDGLSERYLLNGPNAGITKVKYEGEIAYAFPQLDDQISNTVSNEKGYSQFVEGLWQNKTLNADGNFDNISDVTLNGEDIFFGSFGKGIFQSSNETIIDDSNSTLMVNDESTGNVLVSAVDSDREGNLWATNFSEYPLHRMDASGEWSRFSIGTTSSKEPVSMQVHSNGTIWMTLGLNSGKGVLGFNPELEMSRQILTSNSSLTSNQVNEISFTLDNEIWFATDNGVVYFPFASGVISDPTIDVVRPVFEDGYLFNNKKVNCLTTDPGNRKWMGTQEGVWLFNDNASELIHHFNFFNSPLPSNNVLDIAVDPKSGEVFICTDNGTVSFRSDATAGTTTFQNVKIFPNPVLPDFIGLVGFDGLARDANIKITTVSGKLVREINAAGSGASWDVADYNGKRVNSGVYLVFSSNTDGSETYVGKIAVIN